MQTNWKPPILWHGVLSKCNPSAWYTGPSALDYQWRRQFLDTMFFLVHTQCHFYRPCRAGCKRWRKALLKLPQEMWWRTDWDRLAILLDRFGIKRLYYWPWWGRNNTTTAESGLPPTSEPDNGWSLEFDESQRDGETRAIVRVHEEIQPEDDIFGSLE
ncbi:hypothetical protein NMY22_g5796 [Coprinellus aureogranulatus]|nr:hypothetical protein NMY22_g5796 [Coprinellus aureogranulatus]